MVRVCAVLNAGEDNRKPGWLLGALDIVDPVERRLKDFLIEEKQSAESLVLSGGSHIPIDCEV